MHFRVMVIGNDPEGQLAPFSVELKLPKYKTKLVSDEEKEGFVESCAKKHNLSFDELYEKYGKDWNDGVWEKDENKEWAEYSVYNPKSKYDYYSPIKVIKTKGDGKAEIGKPVIIGNKARVSQARKGDIKNLDELTGCDLLKDGEWCQVGQPRPWGRSTKGEGQEEWDVELKKLFQTLPDDTLVSVYDCHF